MEAKKCVLTISEIVYLFYFLAIFGARAVGVYEGMLLYNVLLVVGMALFAVKIAMTEHTVIEYIVIFVLCLVALVVYKNTGEKGFLIYLTMMFGIKGVSERRVFQTGVGVLGIAFFVLVLLSLLGIKEEIFYVQYRTGMGEVFRHSLGYPHPNTLHTTYVILCVLTMYSVGKQNKNRLILFSVSLFVGSLYLFLYSGSKTGLITSVFYLLVNFYFQIREQVSRVEKLILYLLYPACMLFSIICPLVIKGKVFEFINAVLNNRWKLSHYYLTNEPITLFGTRFKEPPNWQYMLDSSFLYSFLQLGLVACCVITVLNLMVIHDCVKKNSRSELAILISFYVMGITDPFLYNLSAKNLIFIFIGVVLYQHLERMVSKVPGIFRNPIILFKLGGKEVTWKSFQWKWQASQKTVVRSLLFGGVVAVAAGTLYVMCTVCPEKVYINETDWLRTAKYIDANRTDWSDIGVYLTQEEVQQLKQEDNLVWDYPGEDEQMFVLEGSIPRMEYIRNIISIGVWSGMVAGGLYLFVLRHRKTKFLSE